MERGLQPLRKQSLLRWHRIRVWGEGCRVLNSGEDIEKRPCLEVHTVATVRIWKQSVRNEVCCRNVTSAVTLVTCTLPVLLSYNTYYCVTKFGTNFRKV
jgi:hypothetical protein